MKQLDRLQPCKLFKIRSPIWNGGERIVGLKTVDIEKNNEIEFLYRRKSDGELSFPHHYYFDGDKLKDIDFEVRMHKGTSITYIPFTELERLERV